jgi:hypothetical protein
MTKSETKSLKQAKANQAAGKPLTTNQMIALFREVLEG